MEWKQTGHCYRLEPVEFRELRLCKDLNTKHIPGAETNRGICGAEEHPKFLTTGSIAELN